jgi:hypothetical protein
MHGQVVVSILPVHVPNQVPCTALMLILVLFNEVILTTLSACYMKGIVATHTTIFHTNFFLNQVSCSSARCGMIHCQTVHLNEQVKLELIFLPDTSCNFHHSFHHDSPLSLALIYISARYYGHVFVLQQELKLVFKPLPTGVSKALIYPSSEHCVKN